MPITDIEKYNKIIELRHEIAKLEAEINDTDNNNNSCRIEHIRGVAVPICGHDILTEFLIDDLKNRKNSATYFIGGLYVPENKENKTENGKFHWYVSTIRYKSPKTMRKFVPDAKKLSNYFTTALRTDAYRILGECYIGGKSDSELIDHLNISKETIKTMNEYGLIEKKDNKWNITANGIQIYVIATHLFLNHKVKPSPNIMMTIMNTLEKILGPIPNFAENGKELTELMNRIREDPLIMELLDNGISMTDIENVVRIYYAEPL